VVLAEGLRLEIEHAIAVAARVAAIAVSQVVQAVVVVIVLTDRGLLARV
jgi:2-keto-4-pentenoate hydratase/2-oxohepta-3-ene-1,7-dioic acid hydratase in catechol pathway